MNNNKNTAYKKSNYSDAVAPTPTPIPTPAPSSKNNTASFTNTKSNPHAKSTKDTDPMR